MFEAVWGNERQDNVLGIVGTFATREQAQRAAVSYWARYQDTLAISAWVRPCCDEQPIGTGPAVERAKATLRRKERVQMSDFADRALQHYRRGEIEMAGSLVPDLTDRIETLEAGLRDLLDACQHDSDGMGPRVLDAMERADAILMKGS